MPWHIAEAHGVSPPGFFVVTNDTGRKHSKKPLTKEVAKKQLAALHIHADKSKYKK
jgi:hypothetical protein